LLQNLLYTLPVDILYRQMSPLMSDYDMHSPTLHFSHFVRIRCPFFVCVGQTIHSILIAVIAQTSVGKCSPPGDQFALPRLMTYLQIVVGMAAVQQAVTYSSCVSLKSLCENLES
jgi:hypothetical protein